VSGRFSVGADHVHDERDYLWLIHFFSPPIAARLSPLERQILNRIGGIILVTIAVQLLAGGFKGLFPVFAGG